MKISNLILLAGLLFTSLLSFAAETAGYYRIWQGFQRSDLSVQQFQLQLPDFMNATGTLYGDVLNQYLVAIPPQSKPSFIPDEFALIALRSEADYQAIRATAEGKSYGERHWTIFSKETSRSLPYKRGLPAVKTFEHDKSYDVLAQPIDWKSGYTTFFIGTRKAGVSSTAFLSRLYAHVDAVQSLGTTNGLRGYIIITNENYEAAYMNWASAEQMQKAFSTAAGQSIQKDAAQLMDQLQWSNAETFDGVRVDSGRFYSTQE